MYLLVGGLSHKTAPVEIRETLEISLMKLDEALNDLLVRPSVKEGVIVSTCNRTEIYTIASEVPAGKEDILQFLSHYHQWDPGELAKYLYFYDNREAINHLFKVTSSLDSMVVGEAQILGQVKEAYAHALDRKATSIILNRLFNHAIAVGKKARSQTSIGESAVSISYAAVELAKQIFEDLTGHTVMILGAGEMGELTVQHLVDNGVSSVLVANRTPKRAEELAKRFKGRAVPFDHLVDYVAEADIVISSTAAQEYVINRKDMGRVISKRRGKPIFLIDIAVPRDIDPRVNKLENVFLYDIDDLEGVVKTNVAEREKEARKVHTIIHSEVDEFSAWLHSLDVTPTIAALRKKADEIRAAEVEKIMNKLNGLSEREKNLVRTLAGGIINKLLHQPIVKIKESTRQKDGYVYVESLRQLFDLQEVDGVGLKRKKHNK